MADSPETFLSYRQRAPSGRFEMAVAFERISAWTNEAESDDDRREMSLMLRIVADSLCGDPDVRGAAGRLVGVARRRSKDGLREALARLDWYQRGDGRWTFNMATATYDEMNAVYAALQADTCGLPIAEEGAATDTQGSTVGRDVDLREGEGAEDRPAGGAPGGGAGSSTASASPPNLRTRGSTGLLAELDELLRELREIRSATRALSARVEGAAAAHLR